MICALAVIAAFGLGLMCGLAAAARVGHAAQEFEEGDRG
jgi:hypothetical protein